MTDVHAKAVQSRLRVAGASSARELARALGVSQPTFSRAAGWLGSDLVRIGRGRSTKYALMRAVARHGSRWPVYRIGADGRPRILGFLHALEAGEWWLEMSPHPPGWLLGEFRSGLFPDFPWFLDDLRPQGFVGRAFARRHAPDLGLSDDLLRWNADDVLIALLLRGEDLPGDFVIGDASLDRAQRLMLGPHPSIAAADRSSAYSALADAAVAGDVVGSSAAGEQPKFTARVGDPDGAVRSVIVKFSQSTSEPAGRRWADLLIAECLAADVLRDHGIAATTGEIVIAGNRCCLEATRFDRVGPHGRVGAVSLLPIEAAHYGGVTRWLDVADRLERDRWLESDDASTLRVLWWFGCLIGNTDMHLGNVSLVLGDELPLALAPSYDMLPMLYRPAVTGEIVPRVFEPPLPSPATRDPWVSAAEIAEIFWRRLEATDSVSRPFRDVAGENARRVTELRIRFG